MTTFTANGMHYSIRMANNNAYAHPVLVSPSSNHSVLGPWNNELTVMVKPTVTHNIMLSNFIPRRP